MKPKLSICIATFNRADFICETLDTIAAQALPDVEVIVVDGASQDNTAEVLAPYVKSCPNFHYIRLQEKGGVDKDFDLAVGYAKGEYCWLLTDDDPLEPDAICRVLQAVERGDFSLIVLNSRVLDIELKRVLLSRSIDPGEDVVFNGNELNGLAEVAGNYLTFIGCIVFKRELWMQRERERYYGSEFIHIGVIFQDHLPGKILVTSDSFLRLRYGNAQWTTRALVIWAKKWPDLIWGFNTLDVRHKAMLTRRRPLMSLRFLTVQRAKKNISVDKIKSIHNALGLAAAAACFLMCMVPAGILRTALILKMKRNYKKYAVSLYDLGYQCE